MWANIFSAAASAWAAVASSMSGSRVAVMACDQSRSSDRLPAGMPSRSLITANGSGKA